MSVVVTTIVPFAPTSGVTFRKCGCKPQYWKRTNVLSPFYDPITKRQQCSQRKLLLGYKPRTIVFN